MRKITNYILISLFIFFSAEVIASDLNDKRGIFSNMKYFEEAGDLVGQELFIFPGCGDYCVLFQIAEGGFPYAELLPLEVNGNKIGFALSNNNNRYERVTFSGQVMKDKIEGTLNFDGVENKVTYSRGKSYWQFE
ncbi:hypothetical protein ACFL4M_01455 [Pseudomonadota bacterium]